MQTGKSITTLNSNVSSRSRGTRIIHVGKKCVYVCAWVCRQDICMKKQFNIPRMKKLVDGGELTIKIFLLYLGKIIIDGFLV